MQSTALVVETPIRESPRVAQVRGLFDLPAEKTSRLEWQLNLPLDERDWHIGLITGPSGCGKSTIARALWPHQLARKLDWPADASLLDAFPAELSIKDVTALLSSVGFSSPPAWLRPFHVLSTGQQFRVTLARLLAEQPDLVVFDEFTSVVDRTVARIGSAALARTVRQRGQRFVAATCHEDVEEWLQPDWVYRPAENLLTWRLLQPRPSIALQIVRCQASAWSLFREHHYLSHGLSRAAVCFLASIEGKPVAFSAWVNQFTRQGGRREHRTVTLPDYQGVGIGHAVSGFCASLWKGLGCRACSTTTHPAFVAARLRSPHWRLIRAPSLARVHHRTASPPHRRFRHATTRLTAGFEYIGPAAERRLAERLLAG
jgi:ABC-type transport system involved in cytochrome c biogenesis ATPase subunit